MESCKKTATPKKLDGKWKATKGTSTRTSTQKLTWLGCTPNDCSSTSTTTETFDGATWTGTMTSSSTDGNGIVTPNPDVPIDDKETMSLSFDKKNGTFEQSFVGTNTYKNPYWSNVYDDTTAAPLYNGGALDRKDVTSSTGTMKGDFQVTGGLGDTDKKSQFILFGTSWTDNWTSTYSYFLTGTDSSVNVTNLYVQDWPNYIKVPTSESGTDGSIGESSDGDVWTVTENKKGTMTMNQTESSTNSDGSNTSSYTEELTLEKE